VTGARVVLHVDMDAFYASVEQHDDPRLAGLPVIVGGNGPRGVVAAASYEVRKFGVRSAMPMRQALERCPQAVCVRPRMARYQEVSRVVFAIFNEFTPLVQGLSLDEAFLDVSASREPVARIAAEIKRRIRERTGLSASVGAATNKLVAKIASDLNKPDGLTLVTPQTLRATLDPLPVRRLPGLGGKTTKFLFGGPSNFNMEAHALIPRSFNTSASGRLGSRRRVSMIIQSCKFSRNSASATK